MNKPNYLINALVHRATLLVKANQSDNGGVIDYERLQEEMEASLQEVEAIQHENDELFKALQQTVAERDDAIEQKVAVANMYNNQSRLMENNFTGWSLS